MNRIIEKLLRTRAVDLCKDLFELLTPRGRRRYFNGRANYLVIRDQLLSRGINVSGTAEGPIVLVGVGNPTFIAQETLLLKAFTGAGFRPAALVERGGFSRRLYSEIGVKAIFCKEDFSAGVSESDVTKAMEGIATLAHLLDVEWRGVRVGRYAASTIMRRHRKGSFRCDGEMRSAVAYALRSSMIAVLRAEKILATLKPAAITMVDRGYTPGGELFELALLKNVSVITWNAGHKNNTFIFKRYRTSNRDVHPCSLSSESWQRVKNIPWTDENREHLFRELYKCYASGDWYSEVGTQTDRTLLSRSDVFSALGLDPTRKTAVIFSHIFWDATFFWGEDLYDGYEEWFADVVSIAKSNGNVNWVIKVHPANTTKNVRDGISGEPSEMAVISKLGEVLPSNIKIMRADDRLSTYSLFSVMDYCLTVRGTVGVEAAALGARVLTAGTGRYDRLGFTLDFDTKEEFREAVRNIEKLPPPSAEAIALAQRFAFATFVGRVFEPMSYNYRYAKDASAKLVVEFLIRTDLEYSAADDVADLRHWIESGDDDYIRCPKYKLS